MLMKIERHLDDNQIKPNINDAIYLLEIAFKENEDKSAELFANRQFNKYEELNWINVAIYSQLEKLKKIRSEGKKKKEV